MNTLNWMLFGLLLFGNLCNLWLVWFIATHWPASGFVRVPKELARERERKHFHDESLADRTIASNRPNTRSRVRKASLRGRRSYRKQL